jgi:hypothetical protein
MKSKRFSTFPLASTKSCFTKTGPISLYTLASSSKISSSYVKKSQHAWTLARRNTHAPSKPSHSRSAAAAPVDALSRSNSSLNSSRSSVSRPRDRSHIKNSLGRPSQQKPTNPLHTFPSSSFVVVVVVMAESHAPSLRLSYVFESSRSFLCIAANASIGVAIVSRRR